LVRLQWDANDDIRLVYLLNSSSPSQSYSVPRYTISIHTHLSESFAVT
jgi:hypothetical protein